MDPQSTGLYEVAVRLDEEPEELLNGGASDGLRILSEISPAGVASAQGIEMAAVEALWDRAGACLNVMPEPDDLFAAAAEAATLLYTAAWVVGSGSATTEGLQDLM
jgi:hypothetical protein